MTQSFRRLSFLGDANPDDIVVHSFAGQDWREIKDWLRDQGLLPRFEGGRRNG